MEFFEFSEENIKAGLQGVTSKAGGLNVADIRNILSANMLKSSGNREELLTILLKNYKKPLLYYRQEWADERYKFLRFTAYYKTELVGFLLGDYHPRSDIFEIMHLEVNEDYRGKGIASKLLSYAIKEALQTDSTIILDDCSDNGPHGRVGHTMQASDRDKHNLYIKNGFQYIANSAMMSYKGKDANPMYFPTIPYMRTVPIVEQKFVIID